MEYNFKDAFIVRAMNEENNDFIITLGDKIATPYHFSNQKEAERAIMKKDWNLIATLAISIAENATDKFLLISSLLILPPPSDICFPFIIFSNQNLIY